MGARQIKKLLPAHGMGMHHIKFVSAWLEQQNLNLSPYLRVRLFYTLKMFFIYKRTMHSDFKNELFQVTNRYMLKSGVQHSHNNILMNGSRNNYFRRTHNIGAGSGTLLMGHTRKIAACHGESRRDKIDPPSSTPPHPNAHPRGVELGGSILSLLDSP